MTGLIYLRFELRRMFRNRRFFFFSVGFPLILYFLIAGPNRNDHDFGGSGISAPLYYMAGLASFGTMMAMVTSGARIAGERQVGWTRQLRITPLTPRDYLRAKVVTAYAAASVSLAALFIAGGILGVGMPVGTWVRMAVLILIALLPFAALGIFLGHLLNVDAIGPATGGTVSVLAFLSGTWFPVQSGVLHDIGQFLPSYWLVQAARIALHGQGWGGLAWTVVAVWTVVLTVAAAYAYRRDTGRV
ncbi:MAG TPA: ABC transporter permease [Gaiellaceae bacterium]|jgi:ABC-2 type transport system permease protein|nr:ABC transporter permease [Gaiellaceae bacterium]